MLLDLALTDNWVLEKIKSKITYCDELHFANSLLSALRLRTEILHNSVTHYLFFTETSHWLLFKAK